MVRQGRRDAWAPTGPGLLVGVIALSVVALVGHFALALVLVAGAVRSKGPADDTGSSARSAGTSPAPLHLDHACLRDDNPATTATIPSDDPFGTDISELGDQAELQRLYAVKGHDLVAIDGAGPVRQCDRQLWQVVVATTSDHVLTYLAEFMVFDADLGASGGDFSVGEVVPARQAGSSVDQRDPDHWRMAIAPNGASDVDVALTVAHEVGHLLTLNGTQVRGVAAPKDCDSLYTGSGCLRDSSLLAAYLNDTWSDDVWDAWVSADDIDDDTKRADALDAFYTANAAHFVDRYAATDPAEDFAESFAVWCAIGPDSPVLPQVIHGDKANGEGKLTWLNTSSNAVVSGHEHSCEQLRTLTK